MFDIAGNLSTTAILNIDGTGSSAIESPGDQDWWKLTLTAGTRYAFRMTPSGFYGIYDPILRLLDASGVELVVNDDAEGSLNSLITFNAQTSGTYYLSAQGYGLNTGGYTLTAVTVQPTLTITANTPQRSERNSGETMFMFTVTREGSTAGISTVNWNVLEGYVPGESASASDFTGGVLPAGTLTFAAGETTKTLYVSVAGDTQIENNETFHVMLGGTQGATLGKGYFASATIINDDIPPTLNIVAATPGVTEGNSGSTPIAFTVTRSGNTSITSSASWAVAASTTNAADFTGAVLPSGTVSFAVGETTKTITINVAGDTLVEADETFTVTLSAPTNAALGTSSATATITNDDILPVLGIAATTTSKAEGNTGNTPFTFTVTRSGNTSITSSASWAVAAGTANAADFTGAVLPSGTVSFAVGETTKTITLNVAGDTLIEGNETFSVVLSSPTGATLGTASAAATILNDDPLPVIGISTAAPTVSEGNSGATPVTFTLTRSGNLSAASTVNWAVSGGAGTAASATDFTGSVLPSGTVSFAAGEATRTITVNVAGDLLVEAAETFRVTLSAPAGATLGSAFADVTIANDDRYPDLRIAATRGSAAEGDSGSTALTFTVTRDGNLADVSRVDWAVSGGTASSADFTGGALPAGTLSFAAGETSKTITLNVAGDLELEADETFNVILSGAQGANLVTATAQGSILSDDTAPLLRLTSTAVARAEGNTGSTPFAFTVTREGKLASTLASSVDWVVTAGTATAADFTGGVLPSGTLSFAAGETSKAITINVAGDTLFEGDETFLLSLVNPVRAGLIAGATGTASVVTTITNDDPAPTVEITPANASRAEGNSGSTPFTFTVTRGGSTAAPLAVDWAVSGGTATAADFTGAVLPTGALSFAAGETSKTITVNVAGDTLIEADETFNVTLRSADATVTRGLASGTILNDEVLPTLGITAATPTLAEGNSGTTPFSFTVTRSGNTSAGSSASWSVGGGTASAADFAGGVLPSGTVSFAAGETTKTITVGVAGDTRFEAGETFTVTLTNPAGATLGTASASATITNDDAPPTLSIAADAARKAEGDTGSTPFTFTVTRSGDTTGTSSVGWSVSGTAASAYDFTGQAWPGGTLSFAAGETTQTITVAVAGDYQIEPDEAFTVTLANPTGATLATATASATITNDDALSRISIVATDATKPEGNSGTTPFTFTVTRTGNQAAYYASFVNWAVSGSSINLQDFSGATTALPGGSLTFAAGETSKTITLNVIGDGQIELDEGFNVVLSGASGAELATASASGLIRNDDSADITGNTTSSTVLAVGSTGYSWIDTTTDQDWWRIELVAGNTYQFRLDAIASGGLPDPYLRLLDAAGTQLATDDNSGGAYNARISFTPASSGTYFLSAQGSAGNLGGYALGAAIVPALRITADVASKAEGNSGTTPFTFTVTRTGPLSGTTTVPWYAGNTAVSAGDFTGGVLPTGTLTFAPGETAKTISVGVAGDTIGEADENFTVTLGTPTNGVAVTPIAIATILNDDPLPTLTIVADAPRKAEGSSGASTPFTFTVTRSGPLTGSSYVGWGLAPLTTNSTDYAGGVLPTGNLSFAAGEATKTITINIAADTTLEGDENFSIYLASPSAATLGSNYWAVATIADDDTLPTLGIAAATPALAEGNSGSTPFTFTVTRSGNTTSAASANWAITGGTANAADFAGGVLPTGTVSFGAGETTKTIAVGVTGDLFIEGNETFTVGLSNPGGATLGTASATATITNDDQDIPANAGTGASLAIGSAAAGLIDSPDDVDWWRVNLTAGTPYAFRLDSATGGGIPDPLITLFSASGDELDSDDDSGVGLNASLIYTPDTSGTYYLAAEALDGDTGGYVITAEAAPVLRISAANAVRSEGSSGTTPFTFTVTRSGPTGGEVRAYWQVEGGTVNDADFTDLFLPGDRIILAPGETTATITIDVAGDALAESDETFNVRLSDASGAVIGTALASGTIRNDDTSTPRPGIDVSRAALTTISVPAAVDDSIDNLVGTTKWGGAIGTSTILTYSFVGDTAVFNYTNQMGDTVIHSPYYALDSSQRQAARDAMAAFSSVCNLTFVEVDDTLTSAGDIRWIESDAPSTASINVWSPGNGANAGDIWLNATDHYADPTFGSYDYLSFLFSIGYAVGLVQPHLGSPAPEAGEDQLKYSVMSARSYDGAPLTGYTNSVYPVSLMLNDVAALQYLYGANTNNHAGDDVYRWGSNNYIYDTLWDAGGNDTLDASNQPEGVTFNLNAGSWSSIGVRFSNGQTMVRDNVTIAYGATIENAIGSGFDDTLIGNDAANTLTGLAGRDTLTGGAGADRFVFTTVGDGGDTITDFRPGDGDKLVIRAPNFGLVAGSAAVLRSASTLPAASGSGGQFLYATTTGQLWFDQDGGGAGAATLVATLTSRPTLGTSDIQLVSG